MKSQKPSTPTVNKQVEKGKTKKEEYLHLCQEKFYTDAHVYGNEENNSLTGGGGGSFSTRERRFI
jgi:hypothetical protein